MGEKTKSKAARAFGIKQMIQNIIMNIILFLILVGVGQLVFHYYTGARWIAVSGAKEIATNLQDRADNAGKQVGSALSHEVIEAVVVRNVRKRASINFPDSGIIKWDLVFMGSFKDSTENMVDRFELRFKYPLKVKLLSVMEFRSTFRGKSHIVTNRNSALRPLATASEAE